MSFTTDTDEAKGAEKPTLEEVGKRHTYTRELWKVYSEIAEFSPAHQDAVLALIASTVDLLDIMTDDHVRYRDEIVVTTEDLEKFKEMYQGILEETKKLRDTGNTWHTNISCDICHKHITYGFSTEKIGYKYTHMVKPDEITGVEYWGEEFDDGTPHYHRVDVCEKCWYRELVATAQAYPDGLSEQSIEMMKKRKLKFSDLDVYPPGCDAWVHYEYRTGKMLGTLPQIISDFAIRELEKSTPKDFKRLAKGYIESHPDEMERIISYCTYRKQMTVEEMICAVDPNAFVFPQFRDKIAFMGDGE